MHEGGDVEVIAGDGGRRPDLPEPGPGVDVGRPGAIQPEPGLQPVDLVGLRCGVNELVESLRVGIELFRWCTTEPAGRK
jgi:hypothetical protein